MVRVTPPLRSERTRSGVAYPRPLLHAADPPRHRLILSGRPPRHRLILSGDLTGGTGKEADVSVEEKENKAIFVAGKTADCLLFEHVDDNLCGCTLVVIEVRMCRQHNARGNFGAGAQNCGGRITQQATQDGESCPGRRVSAEQH
jgi:hypothetical protein